MRNELLEEFAGFTELDSVSFGERRMADLLKEKLKALGFETEEDDAGSHYGGNAGNVYGFLKGSLSGEPVLFSAHMDTVEPGIRKKAIFHEDGVITSDGTTVLGADDAAGLVEILGGIRRVLASGKPHRDIEVLFPIAEEVYTKGSRVFDFSRIRAKEAYVLDLSGPVGIVTMIDDTYNEAKSYGWLDVFLNMINISILLSANLGVMNLLPLPALDGGRLVFLIVEAIRGKPVPPEKEGWVHTAGLVLLMVLMVFILYNDIQKILL